MTRVLRRVLIANRGEVALRVIHSCHALGIETVAVYSDVDAHAPHTLAADRAVRIGPAPPAESYLSIARVLDAARATGADAIHPGYGFLSENAAFARACADADITFVGPSAAVIEQTGSKIACRELAEAAGIPVVPGERPHDQSLAGVRAAVLRIGYPALLKPSAGGGGKGMKIVSDAVALDEAISAARREAETAFGDGTLYVERHLARPRHIEVQVVGDKHGHLVHLGERECSVQRRYQKVIEEAPAPTLAADIREQIVAAAVEVARAAGYDNVGTVEFLVADDPDGPDGASRYYFLEMNTRLQVEHPVTELCTGIDLVQTQLEVAAGVPLPWRQSDISLRGHAIECRLYAEDPDRDYVPQAGPLLLYREPSGPGVRIDAGVQEGDQVTVFYDPLLAKLVTHAATRETARTRAIEALRRYAVLGVRTNLALLQRVLTHPRFIAADIDTTWLSANSETLLATPGSIEMASTGPDVAATTGDDRDLVAALAAAGADRETRAGPRQASHASPSDPWVTLEGWR